MPVDVKVAVHDINRALTGGGLYFVAREAADRDFFSVHRGMKPRIVYLFKVDGLACLYVNKCPYAVCISKGIALCVFDGEEAVGELPVDAGHPCADVERLAAAWHLRHLDEQARQHPGRVALVHFAEAESVCDGALLGHAQQRVAQYAPSEPSRHVLAERLYVK